MSSNTVVNKIPNYKIVVLGEGGVGKSALTLQFVSHRFPESHDATIEDAYQQQAVIDGEACLLDILDTAGQIEFTAMREQYMRCGEGFLICFSITERRSFEEVIDYRKQILKVRAADSIPIVIVGNKLDLAESRKKLLFDPRREVITRYIFSKSFSDLVSTEEAVTLARSMGCPYFETSAALRHYVDDCFHALVKEIRRKQKEEKKSSQMANGKLKPLTRWKRFKNIFLWIFRRKS
ncbi:GTP-binding protein Rit1 [Armadillidium nasatum]|uniref:GTP-binding protein Rit1 n=1 Tax=Armadillidium nasatum TaxID=96803 RepID=A0A5N5TC93_9CRUS|nr:GTP-binding protein Rit1 [Armadillidium nasatum]